MFPDDSYPPVTYPVAQTTESKNAGTTSYLAFLRSPTAKAIFEKYGFSYLIEPTS
jgi:molybdate transport system substrate-binding protein